MRARGIRPADWPPEVPVGLRVFDRLRWCDAVELAAGYPSDRITVYYGFAAWHRAVVGSFVDVGWHPEAARDAVRPLVGGLAEQWNEDKVGRGGHGQDKEIRK